jgi:hypothetical protein
MRQLSATTLAQANPIEHRNTPLVAATATYSCQVKQICDCTRFGLATQENRFRRPAVVLHQFVIDNNIKLVRSAWIAALAHSGIHYI